MRIPSILALACFSVVAGAQPAPAQDEGVVEVNVTTPTGSRGVMTRPAGDGPYPAVLHLFGSGETVTSIQPLLRMFARAGYVALAVEYRESGEGRVELDDVVASLGFLRSSSYVRYGRIALNGFSRGARMALRVAALEKVSAVSAIAVRTTGGDAPTILDEADRLRVPILLQHGTDDPLVPHEDSVVLAQKLEALDREVEFYSYPGAGHNDLPWDRVYERVLLFFRNHLR
jgi:dipeptidyl aminopeptidase/acylaminoacyl peptidase